MGWEASGWLAGAAIHGIVGEAVGVLVFVAEGVGDFEAVELGDAAAGFFPEGFEVCGVDLELALNLLDHEERIGDDAEAGLVVVEGPLEAGEEAGVLGEVVGAVAEEFGELGEDLTGLVVDYGAEAGGAGVTAGSAVAVGDDPAGLGGFGFGEEGAGHGVQCKWAFSRGVPPTPAGKERSPGDPPLVSLSGSNSFGIIGLQVMLAFKRLIPGWLRVKVGKQRG